MPACVNVHARVVTYYRSLGTWFSLTAFIVTIEIRIKYSKPLIWLHKINHTDSQVHSQVC